ncbi:CopD family protein [Sphingomonas nostoxanthinifaciens]|uniref:CopD family protein n=1 Tax=Sphingomonas nostoxanthinifaciens TaxID=2872652 RepID=UPI001CC217E6|nr:CopD family protein [Sphingomonas nostoxanthinifaciens]UAK24649.1 CopD family protein [Sphingomonas nostoxanthinifaciens]
MNLPSLGYVLDVTYQWIKAGHLIFVIFWIAGLFMLPRYYVYHQESPPGSAEERRWIDRERKLRNIILTPSMILVWIFGITLATVGHWWASGWLSLKLLLVLGLSGYHGYMVGYGRKLANGQRPVSGKALRLMNEVPGIATAAIVILVIVKPF